MEFHQRGGGGGEIPFINTEATPQNCKTVLIGQLWCPPLLCRISFGSAQLGQQYIRTIVILPQQQNNDDAFSSCLWALYALVRCTYQQMHTHTVSEGCLGLTSFCFCFVYIKPSSIRNRLSRTPTIIPPPPPFQSDCDFLLHPPHLALPRIGPLKSASYCSFSVQYE